MKEEAQLIDNIESNWRGVLDTCLSESDQLFYGVNSTPVYFGLWATGLPTINFNGSFSSENSKKQVLRRLNTTDSRFNMNDGNTPKAIIPTGGEVAKLAPEAKNFDSRSFVEKPAYISKEEQARNRAAKENFIKPLNEMRAKRKEIRAATQSNQPFPEIPFNKVLSENLGRSSEKVKRRSSESVTSLVVIDLSENKRKSCGLEDSGNSKRKEERKFIKTENDAVDLGGENLKERSSTCESSLLFLETNRNLEQELNAAQFMLSNDSDERERFSHMDCINDVKFVKKSFIIFLFIL